MKLAQRMLATIGTVAVLLGGVMLPTSPALAEDGVNGEVRGLLWGAKGNANWEGTYRMPDGVEAWCASVWQPEPIHATAWSEPRRLTYNDGSYFGDSEMSLLAYVVSEASHSVVNRVGLAADTTAAATSVIIHDMTFQRPIPANGNQEYSASWPLSEFGSGVDPEGTGQDPRGVPAEYASLLAEAQLYHGAWSITLDAGSTAGTRVGGTVSVTGTLRARDTVPVPNKEVSLAITGATGPAVVTTDSDGNFTFDIVTTEEEVSVEASRVAPADVVMMRVPTAWQSSRMPQNMIEVSANKAYSKLLRVDVSPRAAVATSATDQADGDKTLAWDGGVIVDRIKYTGLPPGEQYTVKGELMEQSSGAGTGLLSETTFTPETADGVVSLEFTVPPGHAGTSLVAFERIYDAAGALVAAHEDIDDEAQTVAVAEQPTLGTSATDQADGDRLLPWDGGVIIDQVTFTGLTPGQEYTVTGELIDKATGDPAGIRGETTFTPETADGTVSVEFTVPKGHAGTTLVAFERLYNATGVLQAAHEDIDDEAQTVTVEPVPLVPPGPRITPPGAGVTTPPSVAALTPTGSGSLVPLATAGLALALAGTAGLLVARRRAAH